MVNRGRQRLRPDDVLQVDPRAQLLTSPDGRLLARTSRGMAHLGRLSSADLERVLACIGSGKTFAAVLEALGDTFEVSDLTDLLEALNGDLIRVRDPSAVGKPGSGAVRLFGRGPVTDMMKVLLSQRDIEVFVQPLDAGDGALAAGDVVVVILEAGLYKHLYGLLHRALQVGALLVPLVFDPDGISLGPTRVDVGTACFGCYLLQRFKGLRFPVSDLIETLAGSRVNGGEGATGRDAAVYAAVDEAIALLEGRSLHGNRVAHFNQAGHWWKRELEPALNCPFCVTARAASGAAVDSDPLPAMPPSPGGRRAQPPESAVRTVGIVGGGTAGYLTALALCRKRPELQVTLIESSKIPVIGVGEATTPSFPQFLHADLGLDIVSFFESVQPTLKLGIRFEWGEPTGGFFNYPFGPVNLLEPLCYGGSINDASTASLLMNRGHAPLRLDAGRFISALDRNVAYHVENRRFISWLHHNVPTGIHRIDAEIRGVEKSADGNRVTALRTDDGRSLSFDLYVDCSGFRSLLMGDAMGSPFEDFSGNLFTDRAVAASVPHGGVVQPYTTAETMSAGWCWNTPMVDCDHRGYVFSSAFQSDEEAIAEMRAKNPGMGEPRIIRFRSGRRRHFWKGNVVAVGNSYGFVEPLESTALHMIIRQIGALVQALPAPREELGLPQVLNRKFRHHWDYLAWFLALHFKFNRRMDTPFWRTCREQIDLSAYGELLTWFQERGPLSYQPASRTLFEYPDPLWGAEGIDTILLGQGVATRMPTPCMSSDLWRERLRHSRAWADCCLDHTRVLKLLQRHPHLAIDFAKRFEPAFPVRD